MGEWEVKSLGLGRRPVRLKSSATAREGLVLTIADIQVGQIISGDTSVHLAVLWDHALGKHT